MTRRGNLSVCLYILGLYSGHQPTVLDSNTAMYSKSNKVHTDYEYKYYTDTQCLFVLSVSCAVYGQFALVFLHVSPSFLVFFDNLFFASMDSLFCYLFFTVFFSDLQRNGEIKEPLVVKILFLNVINTVEFQSINLLILIILKYSWIVLSR